MGARPTRWLRNRLKLSLLVAQEEKAKRMTFAKAYMWTIHWWLEAEPYTAARCLCLLFYLGAWRVVEALLVEMVSAPRRTCCTICARGQRAEWDADAMRLACFAGSCGLRESERGGTWWTHTGGGNALAFQPPMRPGGAITV
jgi:hypothetical protein